MPIDTAIYRTGKRSERVLFIAFYEKESVPSIAQNIEILQQLSSFPITVLNLAEHRANSGYLQIPRVVDLKEFDAVIIHNTVSYNIDNLNSLDCLLSTSLKDYSGAKIVLKQDEHYRFSEFLTFAEGAGIDCIYSLMPKHEVAKTYGEKLPWIKIRHMLTSYVTPAMRQHFSNREERPIDIGYRGSIMPLSFGRLCYQKRRIGDEVLRRLASEHLNLDISSRWEDRIGGRAWHDFLSSCKAVLGVESGSGLFDLDGTLADQCRKIEVDLGPDDGSDRYAENYLTALEPLEGQVEYFMISPRHFESIAAGAVQILFPGSYTNRMVAGRHYFELSEDYSNLKEAVELVLDQKRRSEMAVTAFEEVILDKRNWIETFVAQIDSDISVLLDEKNSTHRPLFENSRPAKNVLQLQCHQYGLDPRRDRWYSEGASEEILIHKMGIRAEAAASSFRINLRNELIADVPKLKWHTGCLDQYVSQLANSEGASLAIRELYFLEHTLRLSDADLFRFFGMPQSSNHLSKFRWYLRYFLDSAYTLISAAAEAKGVGAVIAINLPALLPALIVRGLLGVPVLYEALEYWPEADPDQAASLEAFWLALEQRLIRFTDHRGTVSRPLASLMSETFGSPFYFVPNCVPLAEVKRGTSTAVTANGRMAVRFLFQGNFAPHRGLEELIEAWADVNPCALLILRGPSSPFKVTLVQIARQLEVLGKSVHFEDAVPVDDLVDAACRDGDVGLVPYMPTGANYANCSPNKLGQYLCAGLPVLANRTEYVAEIVSAADCGLVVDFTNKERLQEAVEVLCDEELRKKYSTHARSYFESSFNWEAASAPIYDALSSALDGVEPQVLTIYKPHSYGGREMQLPTSSQNASTILISFLARYGRLAPNRLRSPLKKVIIAILGRF
ncbi:glycosyltransferase [Pyruvatibacter mobilis]|uniref:glycosyltransferase n=1 Tax=Pyruvatibacter mobilis TaxID=1712261 RepID=UPI003BABEA15